MLTMICHQPPCPAGWDEYFGGLSNPEVTLKGLGLAAGTELMDIVLRGGKSRSSSSASSSSSSSTATIDGSYSVDAVADLEAFSSTLCFSDLHGARGRGWAASVHEPGVASQVDSSYNTQSQTPDCLDSGVTPGDVTSTFL
jgi:hypothetical protein